MLEITDHRDLRILRMSRPPANALDPELIWRLRQAVEGAPADGAHGLVLAGQPGMFSAGLDVPVLLPLDRGEIEETWRSFFQLMRALAASPIPVAAAIGGHSPAGGAVLALCCDYRVMAEGRFKIGLNEVRVGITLPSTIYRAFELVVGSRRAQLYSVSGDLFDGVEALGVGLVDELVPPEEVEERAVTWLKEQLSLPPAARAATRAFARRDLIRALDAGIETDVSATLECWFSEETQATLADLVASLSKK